MTREDGGIPTVSLCIVTYNSADHIENCLDAVASQTWRNLQVVVVDNNSNDGTSEIIEEKFRNVQLIRNTENFGFAAGQNQAIAASESNYVLVLNPDVTLEPNYIEIIIRTMETRPDVGSACGCLALTDDPDTVDSAGLEMNWLRKASERGGGRPVAEYRHSCEVFGVSGAAAVYSRRMIRHISVEGQFFDEDFFAYKEDVDVAWRAQRLGWKSWYESSARALHVRHWRSRSDRKRIPLAIRRHSYRNRYLMIAKNEAFNLIWWLRFPALVVYEAALNSFILLNDPKVLTNWGEQRNLLHKAWQKRKTLIKRITQAIN